MANLVLGTEKDKRDYLVGLLGDNNPDLPTSDLFKAVGSCYKKYGFKTCVLAFRDLNDLHPKSLFPRLTFACSAYKEVEMAKRGLEEQRDGVEKSSRSRAVESKVAEVSKMLDSPEEYIFKMLCKQQITKEEYEKVKEDPEMCRDLIKKVMEVDR
jgi:hypothetical protein